MFLAWLLALVLSATALWSADSAFSLKKSVLFTKPICQKNEPCRIPSIGLEFCSCGDHRCSEGHDNTVVYQDVEYQFCHPVAFNECAENQVATVRTGLRQVINCLCPEPFRLQSTVWSPVTDTAVYKCVKPTTCDAHDTCMIRNRVFIKGKVVSLLKGFCACPDQYRCKETQETIRSRDVELEQDLFRCLPAT